MFKNKGTCRAAIFFAARQVGGCCRRAVYMKTGPKPISKTRILRRKQKRPQTVKSSQAVRENAVRTVYVSEIAFRKNL